MELGIPYSRSDELLDLPVLVFTASVARMHELILLSAKERPVKNVSQPFPPNRLLMYRHLVHMAYDWSSQRQILISAGLMLCTDSTRH